MDRIDKSLIVELQKNSNRKVRQLASTLKLPVSTVHNRKKKLERTEIIQKYKAVVDPASVGKKLTALLHIVITSKESAEHMASRLSKMKEVEEVYIVSGQFDLIAKIHLKDTNELGRFIFDKSSGLRSWDGIERTESMIVLDRDGKGIVHPV